MQLGKKGFNHKKTYEKLIDSEELKVHFIEEIVDYFLDKLFNVFKQKSELVK